MRKDQPNIDEAIELFKTHGPTTPGYPYISVETEPYGGSSAVYKVGVNRLGQLGVHGKFVPDPNDPGKLIQR